MGALGVSWRLQSCGLEFFILVCDSRRSIARLPHVGWCGAEASDARTYDLGDFYTRSRRLVHMISATRTHDLGDLYIGSLRLVHRISARLALQTAHIRTCVWLFHFPRASSKFIQF